MPRTKHRRQQKAFRGSKWGTENPSPTQDFQHSFGCLAFLGQFLLRSRCGSCSYYPGSRYDRQRPQKCFPLLPLADMSVRTIRVYAHSPQLKACLPTCLHVCYINIACLPECLAKPASQLVYLSICAHVRTCLQSST